MKSSLLQRFFTSAVILALTLCSLSTDVFAGNFDPALSGHLQKTLDNIRQKKNLKGMSAAVLLPNQSMWLGVSGASDEFININADMLFGIGSVTKNFTAVLAMQLAEEEKLSLDDPISKYLQNFANIDGAITIRQLLNHTSGVYNYTDNPEFSTMMMSEPGQLWTAEEIIEQFVKEPKFAPGASWQYSNTNYTLLGMIINKVTKSKLSDDFKTRFFQPNNLANIFLETQDQMQGTVAHNWSDPQFSGNPTDISAISKTALWSSSLAAGGLFSTAADLAQWGRFLFGGYILKESSLQAMTDFRNITVGGANGYGLGTMRFDVNGKDAWGHAGNVAGYASVLMYSPSDSITVAVLINQDVLSAAIGSEILQAVQNFSASGVDGQENFSSGALKQNFPNPFSSTTKISFELGAKENVSLKIYSALGDEIMTVAEGIKDPGSYSFDIDLSGQAEGIYFYRLQTERGTLGKEMIYLKK